MENNLHVSEDINWEEWGTKFSTGLQEEIGGMYLYELIISLYALTWISASLKTSTVLLLLTKINQMKIRNRDNFLNIFMKTNFM